MEDCFSNVSLMLFWFMFCMERLFYFGLVFWLCIGYYQPREMIIFISFRTIDMMRALGGFQTS